MLDVEERIKYFQRAFEIACQGNNPTKKHNEVFQKLRNCIDANIVNKIDSFKQGNRGILLIGGDDDLLSGLVSYVWYMHPLQHLLLGNEIIIQDKFVKLGRKCLIEKIFHGYDDEKEIKTILFEEDGIMNKHKLATVLFFRDLDTTFSQIFKRISRSLKNFKFYRKLEMDRLLHEVYGEKKRLLSRVYYPSIVIINAKKTEGLPKEFLKQFEVVSFDTIEDVIEIDHDRKLIKYKNKTAELEPKQIELFELLWKNKDKVVYRNDIIQELWPEESPYDRQIEKHISNLRDGLEKLGFKRDIIKTHKKSQLVNEGGYEFHSDLSTFLK
ncbi:MAG: winged helix-turn-helix domain-containing protein [Planctomycetota bacterium]|jgi:DNA-binding winged helix-turn-helix (wHTH) protein